MPQPLARDPATRATGDGARELMKTRKRTLTRRGVLWLGQTCNLRCYFCYFLNRIENNEHPEHAFMTLDKSNAAMAEGLMPAEVLAFYKSGDYSTRIEDWPNGLYKFDADYLKASEENAAKLDVNDAGLMVDKASGQYPEHVYGTPFAKIDKGDPKAATKIAWNAIYAIYNGLTSSRFDVNLAFLHRLGPRS